MEFIEGLNLETLAQRIGPMEISDACEVIRQAAQGLQHVFESDQVHRDLKPSNLLVCKSGVKIADLGLAMFNRTESTPGSFSSKKETDDRLTGEHTVLGTVDYMAPEQAEGSRAVDIRADLYSLGCTLFRLLVGRAPYALPENSTPIKKMWAHASAPIPDIRTFRPDVPDKLAAVVERILRKGRAERYSEPRELAEALVPFCGTIDFPTLIQSPPRPPRKVFAGGRSSTLRDSEIRRREAPTPPASNSKEQPTQLPGPAPEPSSQPSVIKPSKYSAKLTVAFACLIVVVAALGSQNKAKKVEIPVRTEVAVGSEFNENVESEKSTTVEQPENQPALEHVWFQQFNKLPETLVWSKVPGVGAGSFLPNSATFHIHSPECIRLENLGERNAEDIDFELEMDFQPHSPRVSFGYYFGFRKNEALRGEFAEFQAIQIILIDNDKQDREVIVARNLKAIDAKNKEIESRRSSFERIALPRGRGSMRYSVKLSSDRLVSVSMGGKTCALVVNEDANSQYTADDYRGPFGVFVESGIVDLQNPKLTRK